MWMRKSFAMACTVDEDDSEGAPVMKMGKREQKVWMSSQRGACRPAANRQTKEEEVLWELQAAPHESEWSMMSVLNPAW